MDIETTHLRPASDQSEKVKDEDGISSDKEEDPPWQARTVSVEPVLYLYLLAGGLQWPAVNSLVYKKVCMMHYDNYTCSNLHNNSFHAQEDIVQSETSHWFLWHNYVYEIPSVLLAIGFGSLSDHYSRRLTIALPVIGQVLTVSVYCISAIFMESHVGYTLIGGLINGISGGWITLYMACFSYLGETTSDKSRTKRVLIAEGIAGLSMSKALVLSGVILDHTSYIFVFALSVGINLLCGIFVMVYIKEPPRKTDHGEKGKTPCSLFLHRMKDAVLTVFKKRENNGRCRILVCMLIIFTSMISTNALYTVGYLFLKRRPLSWDQSKYGYFLALHFFVPSMFLLFVIPWIQAKFRIRDTVLLIIGLTSSCLSEFWFSFCTHSWMVFVVPLIECLRGGSTVLRSTLSQLVHSYELGKMFAVLGAVQSLSGMFGSTLFNTIYPYTLQFWPGFCFTLGTILAIIPASLIWWLHRDLERCPLQKHLSETELDKLESFDDDDRNPLLLSADEEELNEDDDLGYPISKETVIA